MILHPSDGNADQGDGAELRKGRAGEAVVAEEREAKIAEKKRMEKDEALSPALRQPCIPRQPIVLPREEQADHHMAGS